MYKFLFVWEHMHEPVGMCVCAHVCRDLKLKWRVFPEAGLSGEPMWLFWLASLFWDPLSLSLRHGSCKWATMLTKHLREFSASEMQSSHLCKRHINP